MAAREAPISFSEPHYQAVVGLAIACAYVGLLNYLGVRREGNVPLFLAWNVFYVSYMKCVRGAFSGAMEAIYVWCINLLLFLAHHFVFFDMIERYKSLGLVYYVLILAIVLLPTEYAHYYFFNTDPKSKFLIAPMQSWSEISDFMLTPIVAGAYYISSANISYSRVSGPSTYVQAVIFMAILDLIFGLAHCYMHFRAWSLHQKHHFYKRNDLCTYANFYSSFLDGLTMAAPVAVVLTMIGWVNGSYLIGTDAILFAGFFSHNKYGNLYLNMTFFYDLDIFLDLFGGLKVSRYHRQHHDELRTCFGSHGFLGDKYILATYHLVERTFLPLKTVQD